MESKRPPVIVIAGGGTGGHIYPALGIARALQEQNPQVQIHFVGTSEGMETKIIPKEGFPLVLVHGGKLNLSGRWTEKLATLIKLPLGIVESMIFLAQKKPDYVLGVGGYASGPFVLAASLLGYSTGVWEPNAQPGLANRWLSRFVRECFLVFEEAKSLLHARRFLIEGMPVRKEIDAAYAQAAQQEVHPRAPGGEFRILCFGGSQGSRVINTALFESINRNMNFSGVHLVHQIGSTDFKTFDQRYQAFKDSPGLKVDVKEFIFDMPKYYLWADLVICRGGASTLAEVAAFGVPPIVIPLPAADQHQEKNAEALLRAGGAVVIPQRELTPERLHREIESLRANPELREKMRKNLKNFFKPQAAHNIARVMLGVPSKDRT